METVTLSETAMPLQPGNLGRLDNLTPGCCTRKTCSFYDSTNYVRHPGAFETRRAIGVPLDAVSR